MSDSLPSLRRQIGSAGDLRSVVRAMKAMAASRISEYERAVVALSEYYHTIELGLQVALPAHTAAAYGLRALPNKGKTHVIVFGSDQGLVGQFNETLVKYVIQDLAIREGTICLWVVGERVGELLSSEGFAAQKYFPVPGSLKGTTGLVSKLQSETEEPGLAGVYVFHNRPLKETLYEPVSQRLLPLDAAWYNGFLTQKWPTKSLPEAIGTDTALLSALLREYLFISIYRACAESVASENASRLAAMQRADRNIGDLLRNLTAKFHGLRQSKIDEELFEIVAAFELGLKKR